jgi:hypothetical protein
MTAVCSKWRHKAGPGDGRYSRVAGRACHPCGISLFLGGGLVMGEENGDHCVVRVSDTSSERSLEKLSQHLIGSLLRINVFLRGDTRAGL